MSELIWTGSESDSPRISSAYMPPNVGRSPVKHLLIGPQPAVNISIHRLHVVGYADATDWSTLLALPQEQICFTPNPGDVMATLIKYLKLE